MSDATAIDILLDPDATMLEHAQAANARLRTAFPKGYALDATHQPHISCLQRYVKTGALESAYGAVDEVLQTEHPATWNLTAYKYSDDLLRFQQKLIDAVAPFTVQTGTAAAYFTTPEDPEIVDPLIEYVASFVPDQTGKNFKPHVTIGIAPQDYLKAMLAEKFVEFTFSPEAVSMYKLGKYGVAAQKLTGWA